MLSINKLDIRFGDKHLFKNISARVNPRDKIGLVGVNGAGKSTLLKIMAGLTDHDNTITKPKGFTVAYLPQESSALTSNNTLYEEAELAFADILQLQTELEEINHTLSKLNSTSSDFAELLQRQGDLQHELDSSDIYSMQAKIEKILLGLGFKTEDLNQPVSSFSGGWIMRILLAKMLLSSPSLMLLDEPTNHLDLESLTWVENFLTSYHGSLMIISHDKEFLDKSTNTTWELSFGNLSIYKGNYSFYLKDREERKAITLSAYKNQQSKIKQTMQFVDRFKAKSTKAKQAQSRLKQLGKMELIEIADDEHQINFKFPPAPPSGRDVLQIKNLCKSFGEKNVFKNINLELQRGDKVAIIGVNGAGKSTLLKTIAGETTPDSGKIKIGHNVKLSYFGQHQAQELPPSLSALDTMALSKEDMTITQTRSLLGAFLFRGKEVEKKVAVLSGGEKSRLALAKMIATPANCMLLDEPTNHLDISSQEVLKEAMAQYDGTIIVVSHNRYFLDSFVTKVVEVKNQKVTVYEGNISDYLQKIAQLAEVSSPKSGKKQPIDKTHKNKLTKKDQRKLEAKIRNELNTKLSPLKKKAKQTEKDIEHLESKIEKLESLMADPELYKNEEKWAETSKDYNDSKNRLDRLYNRWETTQEKIELIKSKEKRI